MTPKLMAIWVRPYTISGSGPRRCQRTHQTLWIKVPQGETESTNRPDHQALRCRVHARECGRRVYLGAAGFYYRHAALRHLPERANPRLAPGSIRRRGGDFLAIRIRRL